MSIRQCCWWPCLHAAKVQLVSTVKNVTKPAPCQKYLSMQLKSHALDMTQGKLKAHSIICSRSRQAILFRRAYLTRQGTPQVGEYSLLIFCAVTLNPGAPATVEVSRGRRMLMVLPSNSMMITSQRKDGMCTIVICPSCLRDDFGFQELQPL
jgi:hypothetical protein